MVSIYHLAEVIFEVAVTGFPNRIHMTPLAGLISCGTLYPVIEITWGCRRVYYSLEGSTMHEMYFVVEFVCYDVGIV